MAGIGLNTGLRALLTSQFALNTVGNNIANATTPGYSRQRLDVAASMPLQRRGLLMGAGIDARSIVRSVDELLERRILGQTSVGSGLQSQATGMTEIESLFGEPNGASLSASLDGLFTSISDLTAAPDDTILRSGLVQSALAMTSQFNQLDRGLSGLKVDTETQVSSLTAQVNQLASQIANLNKQIAELEAGGLPANDLRDQRQLDLEGLAGLANVDAVEGPNGSLRVLLSGNLLVGTDRFHAVSTERDNMGELQVKIEGSTGYVPIRGGSIGGFLQQAADGIPALDARLDQLAHGVILEMNRIHSTGVPATGPFTSLVSDNRINDLDRDGKFKDELVANAGLPFDVTSGRLAINITDLATGSFERENIDITQSHTTVQDLLDSLNAIDGLSADVDSFGSLRIVSSAGVGFDFSGRLNGSPDTAGTLGGGVASVGTSLQGPFSLANGDTLDLTVDPGGLAVPISVTFDASDFADISAATADEVAAAFNADPGALANGLTAAVVNDRVFIQTLATGTTASYRVDGGPASTPLGLDSFAGSTITGHDDEVDVQVTGSYTGSGDALFTFVPKSDGVIGTTPGLAVDVFDDGGNLVATLAVGDTYVPGTPIAVGEGISTAFGLGEISATHNDRFELDAVDDSDTTDVLVALGLNSMFTGSTAADIDVRQDIQVDSGLLAVSFTGQSGDGSLLLDLLDVESTGILELENATIGSFYGSIVSELGFDISTTNAALTANSSLVDSLEVQRDSVRGVNIDEELVEMLKFEQAFAAASQFISVVNELENELLNLI